MKDELASEIPGWTSLRPPKPPLTAGWITTTTTAASGFGRSYPPNEYYHYITTGEYPAGMLPLWVK